MRHVVTLALVLTLFEVGAETLFAVTDSPRAPAKGIEGAGIQAKVPPKAIEGPDIRNALATRVPAGPGTR